MRVCNALVDRAGKVIDANGVIRKPSMTGLQAILLYTQLLSSMDDTDGAAQERYMESESSLAFL